MQQHEKQSGVLIAENSAALPADLKYRLIAHQTPALEIDAVIHTHLHFDHVGWNTVTDGDKRSPTFRNAVWRVSDEEINWWNAGAVQPHPDYENILEDVFDPIVGEGKVETFSGETLVEPFLTSIPTPGHTPGHTSFLLSSAGEHLLLVGDAAHHPEHLIHHDWVPAVDNDPQKRHVHVDVSLTLRLKKMQWLLADISQF